MASFVQFAARLKSRLPVVAVPVPLEPMPIGVQIIVAPWREDIALRVAHALEKMGAVAAPAPRGI